MLKEKKRGLFLKINPELDGVYFLTLWLIIGSPFVYLLDNLFILIPSVVLFVLNSIYLVIKAFEIRKTKSNFFGDFFK